MYSSSTVLIHPFCSAKCKHCPYGNLQHGAVREVSDIICEIENKKEKLILISGGEPFEYPYLDVFLSQLSKIDKIFRIATGGHIPIHSLIQQLKRMKNFCGISLGTDILIEERNFNLAHMATWTKNLDLLKSESINYSITITAMENSAICSLLQRLLFYNANPDFITLSEVEGNPIEDEEWRELLGQIDDAFSGKKIFVGFKNSTHAMR